MGEGTGLSQVNVFKFGEIFEKSLLSKLILIKLTWYKFENQEGTAVYGSLQHCLFKEF